MQASTPASAHHEHAKAALESGAHVLCEKPMTIDPAQAWDLVATAREVGRELLVSFGWNYSPLVRGARELVRRHGIGRVEQLSVQMSSSTRELLTGTGSYPDADQDTVPGTGTWTDPLRSGGGYGQAQLSHALGLALHLVSERVRAAFALTWSPPGAQVELHDAVCARLDGGGIATISGGSGHAGAGGDKHALQVRAIGSQGQLLVDVEREKVWLYRPDGVDERLPLVPGDGAYPAMAPANALIDVALGHSPNDCAPGELGARTVEALDAVYRSAGRGELVERS